MLFTAPWLVFLMEIPLALPRVDEEMRSEVDRVLQEEFFLRGESVTAFEREFAEYVGTEEAIAVSSGTQALHLSLRAIGVSEGDTVITSPASFIATANAIVHAGATPKFVDISLEDHSLYRDALATAVDKTEDLAAVVPVHLYGHPHPIDELRSIIGDVPILSDACQAHGASVGGDKVGSIADAAAFSFYPSKNMTVAGDGGMVTTDDTGIAAELRSLRDVGRGERNYAHPKIGYTARMNTVNAAVGRKQLNRLEKWNERRGEIAVRYSDAFREIDDLVLPPSGDPDVTSAWYMYAVRSAQRGELAAFLEERGIETGVHYPTPIHLHPPYKQRGYEEGMFPNAEQWADEILSLPVHPHISDDGVDHIVDSVLTFYGVDDE